VGERSEWRSEEMVPVTVSVPPATEEVIVSTPAELMVPETGILVGAAAAHGAEAVSGWRVPETARPETERLPPSVERRAAAGEELLNCQLPAIPS
jgi:hypothetical protein